MEHKQSNKAMGSKFEDQADGINTAFHFAYFFGPRHDNGNFQTPFKGLRDKCYNLHSRRYIPLKKITYFRQVQFLIMHASLNKRQHSVVKYSDVTSCSLTSRVVKR